MTTETLVSLNFCQIGQAVIDSEAAAVLALRSRINQHFEHACKLILACKGRVIVIGMGKSGHIGSKIAATMASTGTPAFFIHPADASHGDLGMILPDDIIMMISNSGSTPELLTLLPSLKRLKPKIICLLGKLDSPLAKAADALLDVSVASEAGPHGLAPTCSTTATLAMGDALAITLLRARGFTADAFAERHPGGNLGKRLLLRIDDLMHTNNMPCVSHSALLKDAIVEMSAKRLGMTTVLNEQGELAGIYTDGDLRRSLQTQHDINTTPIDTVMTRLFHTLPTGTLAADALQLMQRHEITALPVLNTEKQLIGILHIHDLFATGIA